MNLQEQIRKVLKEIEENRVQIRLGRSAERHFGTVQNIIIMIDNQDITSENNEPDLGKMNIVIKDNEIIVGDIFIPEKYRKQGIATEVYQKISDYFGLPIVNSKTKGFNQTLEGGYIWKKRDRFEPKNLQEQISRIQSMMGVINESNFFIRRVQPSDVKKYFYLFEDDVFVTTSGYEQFRYHLVLTSLEQVMWKEYDMSWDELPEQQEIDYVNKIADLYDDTLLSIYNKLINKY